jgi:hypothetical protein
MANPLFLRCTKNAIVCQRILMMFDTEQIGLILTRSFAK